MSTYNTLHTVLKCPRCGIEVEASVDCHFGNTTEMLALKIGDNYPWLPRKQPQNGGRPENGTVDGKGYMECPRCQKDALFRVLVRNDVIMGVEPDTTKPGYVPD